MRRLFCSWMNEIRFGKRIYVTYVIPGTTVVRTVASSRDELTKYFSTISIEVVCD
jgi:hypothetical protein